MSLCPERSQVTRPDLPDQISAAISRGLLTEPQDGARHILRRLSLRKMPDTLEYNALIRPGEKAFLAGRAVRMIAGISRSMQHQCGNRQDRRRIQAGFVRRVRGVAGRKAPSMSIGVQYNAGPVGVVERSCCLIVVLFGVPVGGRPRVPHHAGKTSPILLDGMLPSRRGHEPVVPVVARLYVGERLLRIVRAIANREHHQMGACAIA